jgi:hypothetical protein
VSGWDFATGVLIVVAIIGGIFLIGNAIHANTDQHNKFQLECVSSGGSLQYEPQARELVCKK